ncbi:DUF2332 domain-containing protein [Brevundimonas goettingensis]|uniref:DUF2332 family protein n=1 Tax=Brevundimonas goettingensis TaxID=2774190 RepID=A0A975GWU1_9CAUL|nr:DUF2332 family protein [Brevundimonas goettingensis]QTC89845.1 DUF2332 family protein [Brevundimonas goettingensis]
MTVLTTADARHEFLRQAQRCREMGSPFLASVLEAVDRQLLHAPISANMIMDWSGDLAAAAVALRFNGALHALARRGEPQYLAALYRREHDDFDGAVAAALAQEDRFIANWLREPTQTNEIARAAAILSGLMAAPLNRPMPFELLELGSSCGLNLNLARYAYDLGGLTAGDPASPVRIAPRWRGAAPTVTPVTIASARGVDLHPLNAADANDRERLLSFTWSDQPERSKRLEGALQVALAHPPRIERGDALDWLTEQLAQPQEFGQCRAIVHSMFLQYLPDWDQQAISIMIAAAGAMATSERPLIWIGYEWTKDRTEVELRLTSWPSGETVVLAKGHPYGDWLEWLDASAMPVEVAA